MVGYKRFRYMVVSGAMVSNRGHHCFFCRCKYDYCHYYCVLICIRELLGCWGILDHLSRERRPTFSFGIIILILRGCRMGQKAKEQVSTVKTRTPTEDMTLS